MKQKNNKTALLLMVLCVVALAVAALFATGVIGGKNTPDAAAGENTGIVKNGDTVGQGAAEFAFVIVDQEGNETAVTVKTDKKTVGEALLDAGIAEGENGVYGLYIKKINGIVADWDVDQTYWALYIDGEYSNTGADSVEIQPGVTYTMKAQK